MDDMIGVLRGSHERLKKLVAPLDDATLARPSYASAWSIAEVLSHLGSQAEITELLVDAGLGLAEPPAPEVVGAIWDRWNAKAAREQADDGLAADAALLTRFEALGSAERARLRLSAFGMEFDFPILTGMRLSEHALHSWDIAVALDPRATVAPEPVEYLVDLLGPIVSRSGKPAATPASVAVTTTGPDRRFVLRFGDTVTLEEAADAGETPAAVELPAEAFVRLVFGRLDPAHTPEVTVQGVDLDELRRSFPGI
ncbi:maleylpyruvate isomerase family mycothiol-dependent enzyme [Sphaerisporangium album]|uniref:Maleylpyruvate isomerase family mycothiol-dependent enzyme n=1 Tax=Sphaerisporangium album TaxID=509200 RepID=A0A367F3I9_9ACTN|nr:maleylpyruvate isomerase family mycothiol-dependent enzyme [Sphaerisporangium album]RCG24499.1 maleylpyruvate isomerase family mycothiol-dependent enzyme [Sphaerisporangium album]